MITAHAQLGATNFNGYDGNGNATALVSASGGAVSARYECGPFGEPIRVTGPAADERGHRRTSGGGIIE